MTPLFYKWADLPERVLTPQIRWRLVTGDKLMLVKLRLDKGAVIATHKHPHEQVSAVLSGALELAINGEKRMVRGGEGVVIPSNTLHAVVALEATEVLDVFSPPREDLLSDETPAYMKQ